ncbi:hypothetical protein CDD82_6498 [Ophiocordyceps australis]|uniref:Autophagy-related protein 14 n=1 Tax=Ophiocordyceps australis TaxID=1399860 RepID=A0A2C5YV03_9HYPO|nr:hypothetical protein CDD82_6498 [Ophiocordyceps australis]
MECDICLRRHDAQRRPFFCAVDARNRLYAGRLSLAQRLIDNEKLHNDISRLMGQPGLHWLESCRAKQEMARHDTNQALAAADKLALEIQAARDHARARRAALARRRSDLASISQGLDHRRANHQLQVQKDTQLCMLRWSQTAHDMACTRAFLCHEALKLYGLRRIRNAASPRYDYLVGQVSILDLSCIDALPPPVISTSLAHLCHILLLLSHYLSVRLPAELTLPHRDYPRPTIYTLASSYQHHATSSSSAPPSNPLSPPPDSDTGHVPRPRPLFVDKPLQQLAKEDPATYSLFLEAVTLLAYDIAWLCCSQGVLVGDKGSFDDMCHMGRNLYALLLAAQMKAAAQDGKSADAHSDPQPVGFGHRSHATTFYSLNNAQGTEFVRSFKLSNPIKLADRLKRRLAGDSTAADWEVLDHAECKNDDAPIQINASKSDVVTAHESSHVDVNIPPKIASVNSWTKIKYRP